MSKKQKSDRNGESSPATIETRQDTQSIDAALTPLQKSPPTSVMSASTVQTKPDLVFQPTPNSLPTPPNVLHSKLLHALVAKLGALVSWHQIELGGGRKGWALFFDARKWMVDPLTHELTPLGDE